jgi:hypothetical protein
MKIIFIYDNDTRAISPDFDMTEGQEEILFENQGDADNDLVNSDLTTMMGEFIFIDWRLGFTPPIPQDQIIELERLSGAKIPSYNGWTIENFTNPFDPFEL